MVTATFSAKAEAGQRCPRVLKRVSCDVMKPALLHVAISGNARKDAKTSQKTFQFCRNYTVVYSLIFYRTSNDGTLPHS